MDIVSLEENVRNIKTEFGEVIQEVKSFKEEVEWLKDIVKTLIMSKNQEGKSSEMVLIL